MHQVNIDLAGRFAANTVKFGAGIGKRIPQNRLCCTQIRYRLRPRSRRYVKGCAFFRRRAISYLVKIVRNISLKIYYRKEAAKRNSTYTIALEEIEACIADQKNIEEEIEVRELACIIESFLDTLTIENRVIFMRRYWFSDSYKDIAEFVGLSEKNISVRLTRIREKMKQYLIEREVFV